MQHVTRVSAPGVTPAAADMLKAGSSSRPLPDAFESFDLS